MTTRRLVRSSSAPVRQRIPARASLGHTCPMDIVLRPALASDASFLVDMLVAAAFWRPDQPSGSRDDVLNTPELAHYASGWPKPGDLGFVAENDQPVGAAWLRFFPVHDPGFGFLSADIPEVGMGVIRQWRSKGVGRRLLQTLIEAARGAGIPALSLSVETDNYARRLYEGCDFVAVAQVDGSVTMRLQL